ncbi:Proton-dependent oligopeptide transporter family [Macleaya cordata]|uniref:Proton-dependent oligopeptide transporter family n=1 Tax=Macleaya cordata TaxID=56857 RepID=A0A200R4L6_MACCD|nr:Proton-dependent oligopeptide transporter family [Macleaya cordata]
MEDITENNEAVINRRKTSSFVRWHRYYFGVPKSCFFIEGVLVSNSIVEAAAMSILMTYLTDVREEKLTDAAATVNVLEGMSGLLSVAATFFKDSLGCYPIVLLSSILYSMILSSIRDVNGLGQASTKILKHSQIPKTDQLWDQSGRVGLVPNTIAPDLNLQVFGSCQKAQNCVVYKENKRTQREICLATLSRTKLCPLVSSEASCIQKIELPLLYMALIFLALGKAGSSSSCIEDFLEDQLKAQSDNDEKRDNVRKTISLARCRILGVIFGNVFLAIVDNWTIRFGISAFIIRFTLGLFSMGTPLYVINTTDQVSLGHISGYLRCFQDRAANRDSSSSSYNHQEDERNTERRLCTVRNSDQVKGMKTFLLRMVMISSTFLMYGIVKSIGSTFFLEQGNNMDRDLGGGHDDGINQTNDTQNAVPLTILLIVKNLSRLSFKYLVELFLSKRLRRMQQIYATLLRIGVGMLFSIICCSAAQLVEAKRLSVVKKHGLLDNPDLVVPMSVLWLLPQFISLGAMKGLAGDGLEVFFEHELPDSVKSYASAFTEALIGVGTLFSVILVAISGKASKLGGRPSWFADTINRSHLDQFYRTLTILCLLNLFLYAYISTSYTYKRLTKDQEQVSGNLVESRTEIEIEVI